MWLPQLHYPVICQLKSTLLPCPVYCKQCCNEHWIHMSFQFFFSQCICPVFQLLGHMVVLILVFKGTSLVFSIVAISISLPPFSLNSPQYLMLVQILMMTILTCMRRHLIVILIFISFMMSDVAPLFICLYFCFPLYFFYERTDLSFEKIQQIV